MIYMTKTEKVYLMLSSLSVYRNILNRSVVKGYLEMLKSFQETPDKFLSSYGEFYHLLCERGVAHRLAYTVTQAALFDENAFALAATAGKADQLSDSVIQATLRDCNAIKLACTLTPQEILADYKYKDELQE